MFGLGQVDLVAGVVAENSSPVVVCNAILYDSALEKACLARQIPTCSQSEKQAVFTAALKLMKQHLLDLWKQQGQPFLEKQPKYKAQIDDDALPSNPDGPSLTICRFVDGLLVLPRDARQEWLTDAVRSPEWRKILQEFDRHFSTADAPEAAPSANGDGEAGSQPPVLDWQTAFPGEPATSQEFHERFESKIKGKFSWAPELTGYIVQPVDDGPADDESQGLPIYHLYLEASQDYELKADEGFLTYGAGAWLTEAKAEQFLENAPSNHRAVQCEFTSDSAPVFLEDRFMMIYSQCA